MTNDRVRDCLDGDFSEAQNLYRHKRVRPLKPRGGGVVKSLELIGSGPVGLVYPQNFGIKSEKPTCVSCVTLKRQARLRASERVHHCCLAHFASWFPIRGRPLHLMQGFNIRC